MADYPGSHIPGLLRKLGRQDGSLDYGEAVNQTSGQGLKFRDPETRPLNSDRPDGDVKPGDLPVCFLDNTSDKIEQFCDAVQHVQKTFENRTPMKAHFVCVYM